MRENTSLNQDSVMMFRGLSPQKSKGPSKAQWRRESTGLGKGVVEKELVWSRPVNKYMETLKKKYIYKEKAAAPPGFAGMNCEGQGEILLAGGV